MLAYNVDRHISASVALLAPHIDKLFIAHPSRPFSYNTHSRATLSNATSIESLHALGLGEKLEIIAGDWETEEAARNACLTRATEQGFDWLLIVDADELYTDAACSAAKQFLKRSRQLTHVTTTWYNFYKSSYFVVVDRHGSIKSTNAGFAVRCGRGLSFTHKRLTNATASHILDIPCYHYGYVMSDDEMATKVHTWSHSQDFNVQRWYKLKWLRWSEDTRNLHCTNPPAWKRTIRFPLEQPSFAHDFAFNDRACHAHSLSTICSEWAYDAKASLVQTLRTAKATLKLACNA